VTDKELAALRARVARLVADAAAATEELLAELECRERGGPATVTPISAAAGPR
jgi:hypothetical protein